MAEFVVHTLDSAPNDAKPLLEHSRSLYGGMIPNLHGVMAESPALLEAYQVLNELFNKTSLDTIEKNIVWLAVNFANNCHYCMAAHSAVAMYAGLGDKDLEALRSGTPMANAKHEALRRFTLHMVEKQGWPEPAEVQALLDAGYTNATVLDVVFGIGMKTLSNYTNHIANTPVDKPFEKFAWERPE